MSESGREPRRRAEDKIQQLLELHAKLLDQITVQHAALMAMERELEEVLATVRTAREAWTRTRSE